MEISPANWKTLANFFPFPHDELKMTKMKFARPGERSPEKELLVVIDVSTRWMTSAHDVETSVTTSSPFQDSFHPHEQMKETQVEFIDLIKHFLPDWNSSQMA